MYFFFEIISKKDLLFRQITNLFSLSYNLINSKINQKLNKIKKFKIYLLINDYLMNIHLQIY